MTDTRRGQRFDRTKRLRRRADYVSVQERGRRVSGQSYVLLALPRAEPDAPSRVGITVSRKIGKAVVRNKVKRWVRETCRRLLDTVPAGFNLVVVARPPAATSGLGRTADEIQGLFRRLGSGKR